MFCSQCGQPLVSESDTCPHCGRVSSPPPHPVSLKPEANQPHPVSLGSETVQPHPILLGSEADQPPPLRLGSDPVQVHPISLGSDSPGPSKGFEPASPAVGVKTESLAQPVVLKPDPSPSSVTLIPDPEPAPGGVKPIWVGLALVLGIALGAVGFPLLKGLLSGHPAATESPATPESSPAVTPISTPSPTPTSTLQAADFSGAWQVDKVEPQQENDAFANSTLEWKYQDGSLEGPLLTPSGFSFLLKFKVTNIDSAVRGAITLEGSGGQEVGLGALSRQGTGIRLMLMTPSLGTRTLDLRALTPADQERLRMERNGIHCKSNLKNMATALEMYSTDNAGRYPLGLEALTAGNYLKLVPSCPTQAAYGYEVAASPDRFTLTCRGTHPQAGYPQYSSDQGLLESP